MNDPKPTQTRYWTPLFVDQLSTRLSSAEFMRRLAAMPIFLMWNWIDARILAALYFGVQISEADVEELDVSDLPDARRALGLHVWRGKDGLCCDDGDFFEQRTVTNSASSQKRAKPSAVAARKASLARSEPARLARKAHKARKTRRSR